MHYKTVMYTITYHIHTLFTEKIAEAHIRSSKENLPLLPTQLEKVWLIKSANHPNVTNTILLHFLKYLCLHHITNFTQLTMPNGTHLMNIKEFTIHHGQSSRIIKNIFKLAEKLFCHPTSEINFYQPCLHHQLPCTLLPQIIIPP